MNKLQKFEKFTTTVEGRSPGIYSGMYAQDLRRTFSARKNTNSHHQKILQ